MCEAIARGLDQARQRTLTLNELDDPDRHLLEVIDGRITLTELEKP